MKTLTLNIPDENDYSFLVKLLQRLGIKPDTKQNSNGKNMKKPLDKLAASGGIKSIPDPSEWQKQIRKDRNVF